MPLDRLFQILPPGFKLSDDMGVALSRLQTYVVDEPLIFQLSQSEALQSVTAFLSFNLEECFVTITNLI